MVTRRRLLLLPVACLALVLSGVLTLSAQSGEAVDLGAIQRIKEEGFDRSKVMDTAWWLTDMYGPRLTNSPQMRAAADWAVKKMNEWGLANVKQEPWGSDFGRGWSNERTVVQVVKPEPWPVIAYAKAWTPGTNGPVTAEAILAPMTTEADLDKFKGKLKGKVVLLQAPREVKLLFDAPATRFSKQQLDDMMDQPMPRPGGGFRGGAPAFRTKLNAFLIAEGVAAVLEPGSGMGDSGSVLVASGGSRDAKDPPVPSQLAVSTEHYNRMARLLEHNVPVTLDVDVRSTFHDKDLGMFNIVAEIAGTDKADEVVMLGAHFDSWHGGTGATDNAAGSAVMMEAMRILKQSGLKLRRTVRLGLWTGEEQGLIGSRAYVKNHFGDPETMQLKPEQAKLAGYFNMDNGTGAYRGVYLQGNEAVAPIFKQWMSAFENMGMTHLTIRNTGGTDHLSYSAVGLSGFQFIQDDMQYGTRTHHTNLDVYDQIVAADMMKNAVITAAFVYQTANREQQLPRKALPKPAPRPGTTSQP
jgi:carboxypeptidase Q